VFKQWRKAAGPPHCSAHGLRKVATIRLIEAGCTRREGRP
jgi:integrase